MIYSPLSNLNDFLFFSRIRRYLKNVYNRTSAIPIHLHWFCPLEVNGYRRCLLTGYSSKTCLCSAEEWKSKWRKINILFFPFHFWRTSKIKNFNLRIEAKLSIPSLFYYRGLQNVMFKKENDIFSSHNVHFCSTSSYPLPEMLCCSSCL